MTGRRSLCNVWYLVHSSGAICCQSCRRVIWLAGRAVTRCWATPTWSCQSCHCWRRWPSISCIHTPSVDFSSSLDSWRSVASFFPPPTSRVYCFLRHTVCMYLCIYVYTLCLKKTVYVTFYHNFGNCWPIFKFLYWLVSKETLYVTIVWSSTSPYLCCYTTLGNMTIMIAADFNWDLRIHLARHESTLAA